MNTSNPLRALLLGVALAAGLAACKDRTPDMPAPVTAPETTQPAPQPVTPEPSPTAPMTPPPEVTPPSETAPAGTTPPPPTSGDTGTQGTTGAGQPPSTAPDRTDRKDPQRERRPSY